MSQSTAYRAAEQSQTLRIAYLYIAEYAGTLFHLAHSDQNLVVEGMPAELGSDPQTFSRAQVTHTAPEQSIEVDDGTKVTLDIGIQDNTLGAQLRAQFLYSSPDKVTITIVRAQVQDGNLDWTDDCFVISQWVATSFSFPGSLIRIELLNLMLQANGKVPRYVWQKSCQKPFGDQTAGSCGLNLDVDAFRLETEIFANSRAGRYIDIADITIDGDPITATTFQGGKIELYDGSAALIGRVGIMAGELLPASSGVRLYLSWWSAAIANGIDIKVFKGCARTKAACLDYGNLENFGGFPYIPDVSPSASPIT